MATRIESHFLGTNHGVANIHYECEHICRVEHVYWELGTTREYGPMTYEQAKGFVIALSKLLPPNYERVHEWFGADPNKKYV